MSEFSRKVIEIRRKREDWVNGSDVPDRRFCLDEAMVYTEPKGVGVALGGSIVWQEGRGFSLPATDAYLLGLALVEAAKAHGIGV